MGRKTASKPARSKRSYGEESRELIIAAASRLFARKGLESTSMADLAREAHLSRATVFNQFGTKRHILDAITARSLVGYCRLLETALDDTETPTADLVRWLYDRLAEGLERNRALYREVFVEIQKTSIGLDAQGEASMLRQKAFDLLVAVFERGQQRAEMTRDLPAEALAAAFDSLLSGAVSRWLNGGGRTRLRAHLRPLAEVFLGGALRRK